VNAYPDASFLVSLYVQRATTPAVRAHLATMQEPLHVGSLLRFEACNAIRREAYQRKITEGTAVAALAAFDADVDAGRVVILPVEWETVHAEAERISNAHGLRRGDRVFDVLHVAAALTLGAKVLLTFDGKQAALAKAEGLKVKP
jgi:predicted nucleic acid-binding protein